MIPPLLNIAKGQGDDFRSSQSIIREKRDDRGRRAEVFQQGFPGGAVPPCGLSQLPTCRPSLRYSFTRRMPETSSGLSKPVSAASYAKLRPLALDSRTLI